MEQRASESERARGAVQIRCHTGPPSNLLTRPSIHPPIPNSRRRRPTSITTTAAAASPEPSDAERTTEKFGLEAGLWKVLTSKGGAGRGDSPTSSSADPNAPPLTKAAQAKALLKTYGSAYLITSISFAVVSFGACYALVSAGVDVGSLLEKVGLAAGANSERVGTFAIAYAAHKALSPVRFPPTVALTPVVARWLGRKPAQEGE